MSSRILLKNKLLFLATTIYLIAPIVSCVHLGPTTLKSDRNNYNLAIQKTNDQQLLLNLTRLKYRDTPFFMEVGSVASQFILNSTVDAKTTLQKGVYGLFNFGGSLGMTEKPTVTYSPLKGERFIQRVLSPLSLKTVVLLFHSGWSIERIIRLCFQQLNNLKNAPGASGPTPNIAPDFKKFALAVKFLRNLQVQDALNISYQEINGSPKLILHISEDHKNSQDAKQFALSVNVEPGKTHYTLIFSPDPNKNNQIKVATRSLLGIMFYLSQSVEVPNQDILQGKVTQTKTKEGNIFNWREMTGDVLRIRSISEKPQESFVEIFYRDAWFYIHDSDLSSKSTFALLGQIFSLQAGKIEDNAPFLTLPIGQ